MWIPVSIVHAFYMKNSLDKSISCSWRSYWQCQTCCFALSAQTSRLLNHIPSPPSDPVNLELAPQHWLWRLSAEADEDITIAEQSSAELAKVRTQTVNSLPVIHNSPRYTVPPTVQGYPGFLTELPTIDLKEPYGS